MVRTAVTFEKRPGHIALVTLDRPERRNAITGEMACQLEQIIQETEADPDIWTVVLTGAGDVFCAGADLAEVAAGNAESLVTEDGGFAGFVRAKRQKLWICAANGPAVAGGFEILLACDLALASETAHFALPEVKRGLVATAGGLIHLPRILPKALAFELITTGDAISAEAALKLGIVSQIHDSDALLTNALDLADRITKNAPLAVRESLALARMSQDLSRSELFDLSCGTNRRIVNTEDAREGSQAFLERRTAVWRAR